VWTNPYLVVPAGALCGAALAAVAVCLGHAGDLTPVVMLAGLILGALSAAGLHRLLTRGPLRPAGAEARAVAEVEHAYGQGYEVVYRRGLPAWGREKWLCYARRDGRTCGYLDADYMPDKNWLFVENVYVDDRHGDRGLATALLLCAARLTGCRLVTTSGRTRQGVRFFDKTRPVLQKYGIELRDTHP
jgi:hypothetical protein